MYYCESNSSSPARKRFRIMLMLIAVISSLNPLCYGQANHKNGAAREIRALLERQVAAWNRRDLEGFMEGYWRSPDLTFFSNNTVTSGWQETLQRYRNRYLSEGHDMGKLEFLELNIEILGPRAGFVRGRYQLKGGSEVSSGLFTLTLKKMSNGWRIIHDHTSTAA